MKIDLFFLVVIILSILHILLIEWKSKIILLLILTTSMLTEIFAIFNANFSINIHLLYSLSFIIHQSLWIFLLSKICLKLNVNLIPVCIYILFCVLNFFFIEKTDLNYLNFVIGAFIYLILFIIDSSKQLRLENLDYFIDTNYLLITTPVIFFIGFSFIFSFRNSTLKDIMIFEKMDLYGCISLFVNIIYYSLINLYIYRQRKLNG